MQVVVTAASSALGQAMLQAIVARGALSRGDGEPTAVRRVIAVDRNQPARLFLDSRVEYVRGDYEQPRFLARMMGASTDSIFHLSALGAGLGPGLQPADLDAALLRSFDTTRVLLQACGFQNAPPKLVLASTAAARPESGPWPQTTEGVCAALCELLLAESARRHVVDARCVRLPCVVGNRSCAQDLALQELLANIAAGRAAPDAAQTLTADGVAFLDEVACFLLDAHERPGTATSEAQFIELPGRRVPIGKLVDAHSPVPPSGALGA